MNPLIYTNDYRLLFRSFAIVLCCGLVLAATPVYAQLEELTSKELRTTYVKPNVDLTQYTQVLLKPLNLNDTRIVPPSYVDDPDPRQWQMSDSNRQFLKAAYERAMTSGLEESGEFNVVDKPFRGTVELEIQLISLTPYAPRGDKVKTRGFGELAFEASLRDARTGELLAMFEGVQQVGEDYQENTDFNQGHNFASHFKQWGRNVSARMSAIHTILR